LAVAVGRLTRSLPLSRPHRLPLYVARIPAAPFCETPILGKSASDTDALQFWGASGGHYAVINQFAQSISFKRFRGQLLSASPLKRFNSSTLSLLISTSSSVPGTGIARNPNCPACKNPRRSVATL